MQVREAKDFPVGQTVQQSQMEGIPLSDLEKRMMYFTESEDTVEDPVALNEEFEAEHDSAEYETKIPKLLNHAHRQIKKESPETARDWDEAIVKLREGDHYLSYLWDLGASVERPPFDLLKLVGSGVLLTVVFVALVLSYDTIAKRFHFQWNPGPNVQHSIPIWFQRLVFGLIVSGYIYLVLVPFFTGKPAPGISQLLVKFVRRKPKDGS